MSVKACRRSGFVRLPAPLSSQGCGSEKFIELDAGPYQWDYLWSNEEIQVSGGGADITGAAYFEWMDCLIPEDGYYIMNGSIFNEDLSQVYDNEDITAPQLSESMQVTWGTKLIPLFGPDGLSAHIRPVPGSMILTAPLRPLQLRPSPDLGHRHSTNWHQASAIIRGELLAQARNYASTAHLSR
jgi:hypothetical protein